MHLPASSCFFGSWRSQFVEEKWRTISPRPLCLCMTDSTSRSGTLATYADSIARWQCARNERKRSPPAAADPFQLWTITNNWPLESRRIRIKSKQTTVSPTSALINCRRKLRPMLPTGAVSALSRPSSCRCCVISWDVCGLIWRWPQPLRSLRFHYFTGRRSFKEIRNSNNAQNPINRNDGSFFILRCSYPEVKIPYNSLPAI